MDMVFCIFFSLLAGLGFERVFRGLKRLHLRMKKLGVWMSFLPFLSYDDNHVETSLV